MVTKIGYGVVSQALINGTPLIYLPREDFAEFPVLEKAIQEWGHGYRLSKEDYCTLKWERVLEEVSKRERPKPVPSEGGRICARKIENLIRRSNLERFPAK
jgi:UDP:flavonoid glycosyltransferase YjiC (YdhE family)